MKVLVTGAAGYIGSHTMVELLNAGFEVVGIDNFSNSKREVLAKIKEITHKDFKFYEGNVEDRKFLDPIFSENDIGVVIHFAGFKAVGESVAKPLKYYNNNIMSTIALCEVMAEHGVYNLIFSSSATVYGKPNSLPIKEDAPLSTTNPYGTTKLMIEQILKDLTISSDKWHIVALRYFNPIGAHTSGLIGENPNDIPNNLMPYIVKVALKQLEILNVYGNDYDTVDGTGVRDYIHVVDLAMGHIKAIDYVLNNAGITYFNLGTGKGFSVLELIKTFERVNDICVNYRIVERRPGDIAACYADCHSANTLLHWQATKGIEEMCLDAYNFACKNTK